MRKSFFFALSWFLVLIALAVGVLTLPVKIWPTDEQRQGRIIPPAS